MVPSDLRNSLFPGRHARPERGIRKRCDVGPLLPGTGFSRSGSMLRRASANFSDRSPCLDAAFRSPATRAGLAASSRSRVNVPDLHLRHESETFVRPFGYRTPVPGRPFIASRDTIVARNPLPTLTSGFPVCLPAAAPLQDLSILQARCAQPDSNQEGLP